MSDLNANSVSTVIYKNKIFMCSQFSLHKILRKTSKGV